MTQDLNQLTYGELKKLAKDNGISINQKKHDLIFALKRLGLGNVETTVVQEEAVTQPEQVTQTIIDETVVESTEVESTSTLIETEAKKDILSKTEFLDIITKPILKKIFINISINKLYSDYVNAKIGVDSKKVINWTIKKLM